MLKMITKVKIPNGDGGEVYKDFPTDQLQFKRTKQVENEDKDEGISLDVQKILD